MQLDEAKLKEKYKMLSYSDLVSLQTEGGLTEIASQILNNEISTRELDPGQKEGVKKTKEDQNNNNLTAKKALTAFLAVAITICVGFGIYFIGLATYYESRYLSDTSNSLRHEYLEGVFLSLLISIPFWATSSGLIFFVKHKIPKWLFWGINLPTLLLLTGLILSQLQPIVMELLGN